MNHVQSHLVRIKHCYHYNAVCPDDKAGVPAEKMPADLETNSVPSDLLQIPRRHSSDDINHAVYRSGPPLGHLESETDAFSRQNTKPVDVTC